MLNQFIPILKITYATAYMLSFCEQFESFIYGNYLDLLGIVLPLMSEKRKYSIGHHQFQGDPILK